jgi:hypothetical protein
MAGIAATLGSPLPAKGHGSRAHACQRSGEVAPGAHAAWRAMEKTTSFSDINHKQGETPQSCGMYKD